MGDDNSPQDSVIVAGEFIKNSTVVPQSLSQIIIATGVRSVDHKPVLIPYVELSLQIERPVKAALASLDDSEHVAVETEDWTSQTMPLENAFWLTLDMMRDLSIACERLQKTMPDGALFESERIEQARDYVESASKFAERCNRSLAALARQAKRLEKAEMAKRPAKRRKSAKKTPPAEA